MAIRPQPYRFKWPWSASQVEGVDESFQILFKAVRTLERLVAGLTGAPTTTTVVTVAADELGNGGALARRGRDGEDSTRSRPPVGSYLQGSYVPLIAGVGAIGTMAPTLNPLATAAPALDIESTVSGQNAALRVGASIGANSAYVALAGNRAIDLQSFAGIRGVNSVSGSEVEVASIFFTKDGTDSTNAASLRFFAHNGTSSASRMIVKGTGQVGIGTVAPTAELHIAAGTATANTAPLKFTSGTLLGTAEAGAIEFLTDAYYGTITTAATRKTFAFLESPQLTTPNIGAATATTLATGAITETTDGIITTSTNGIVTQNTTAATLAVPVQMSPRTTWSGRGWDTDDTVSRSVTFFAEVLPVSNVNLLASTWQIGFVNPTAGTTTYPLTMNGAGSLTLLGNCQISNGSAFYWATRSFVTSPADAQITVSNTAASAGVGLDFATDATLKIRTRAQTGDAQLSAASVRGNAVTFANRPGTAVEGMLCAFTDSTTLIWGTTITGTGTNHVLGYYNGTNWTVAGI